MIWPATDQQERFSEILLDMYAAEDVDDFRTRTLTVVHTLFGGELACHNEINLRTGDSLSALSQPIEQFQALRPAFFDHVEEHPSVQHHLAAGGGETAAVKTSDFVSQRRWRGSGLYSEFYRPLADVRFQLTIGQRIDDWLIFFAVSRRHRDFTERERAMLTMLRPHFILAYRNAGARARLHALRADTDGTGPDAVLDGDATAFALMRRHGLSRREAQALIELARGRTNTEIAPALGISVSSLKTRLERVFRKLGVRTRTAAALHVFALRDGDD